MAVLAGKYELVSAFFVYLSIYFNYLCGNPLLNEGNYGRFSRLKIVVSRDASAVGPDQIVLTPERTGRFFLLRGFDQFDGREETDLAARMFDGLNADCRCDVRNSSAQSPDQDDVVGTIHELAVVQLTHRGFIDLAGGEVEPGEVFPRAMRGVFIPEAA